ncbi:MAG: DUF58 domain-containing protein [Flavobacteriales bacterium]|nr:DUF58 domain-containing protein [Flavobacteriales bacterium]
MNASDLLKKVRQIEIKTRGLSNHIFAGEYNTAFKGKGMAFSEVRDYQNGDDVRLIDWNVTARYNSPFVKVFEEEREMTVMLIIDVSGSNNFGSNKNFKKELATEIGAVLAFSAIKNNDKVGVIFFSDIIEKFIPPKKGKKHILRIIREIISFKPSSKKTDLSVALEYFNSVISRRSICFILSDFISTSFKKPLQIASRKHDVVALKLIDKREEIIPNIGLVPIEDAESGKKIIIDTSSKFFINRLLEEKNKRNNKLKSLMNESSVDLINLYTGEDYVKPLINFFKKRSIKR